jgi:hypothetical protein
MRTDLKHYDMTPDELHIQCNAQENYEKLETIRETLSCAREEAKGFTGGETRLYIAAFYALIRDIEEVL